MKLVGSPPSFVGWDSSGELLKAVSKGARVLVFDELSLFHPNALGVLSRLLDEGVVVGGNGVSIPYRGPVIMTDNGDLVGSRRLGFAPAERGAEEESEKEKDRVKEAVEAAVVWLRGLRVRKRGV